jgi:hypothetical protein
MGPRPTQMLFGDLAIGHIGEGTGFGYQVTGRGPQGLMQFGFLVIGSRDEVAGPGFLDIGNTANKFGVRSFEFGV